MAFYGLLLAYSFQGNLNFIAWREKMEVMLEDNGLKELFDQEIAKTTISDALILALWNKCVAKVRWIILKGFETMWKKLTDFYQNNSDQRKLALKDKLRKIKMEKGETIPKCLTKFPECHDELGSVGITVARDDMVSIALLGLPKS